MVNKIDWGWAFYLNFTFDALWLWKDSTPLEQHQRPNHRQCIDLTSIVLLIVAIGAITMNIVQSASLRCSRAELSAATAIGLISTVGFIVGTGTAVAAVLDLSLPQKRTYAFVDLSTLTFECALSKRFSSYFFFMIGGWQYSLPRTGLAVEPRPLLAIPKPSSRAGLQRASAIAPHWSAGRLCTGPGHCGSGGSPAPSRRT